MADSFLRTVTAAGMRYSNRSPSSRVAAVAITVLGTVTCRGAGAAIAICSLAARAPA